MPGASGRDPNTGKEMPVQRIGYLYHAHGTAARDGLQPASGQNLRAGVRRESSALETNPFKEGVPGAPANPNAKPVGR